MGRASSRKRLRRERAVLGQESAAGAHLAVGRGCLVCLADDGGFSSREHPIPESLGNIEIVLPVGIVCDRCNHGPLATLDKAICEFMPIKMRRTMLGIPSKAGIVPTTRLGEGVVEHVGPSSLRFSANGEKEMLREISRQDGQVQLRLEVSGGRRLTPRYGSELSRALLKTALELAWLDHGEEMFDPRFDHVRSIVLGAPWAGFLVVGTDGDPDQLSFTTTYGFGDTEEGCRLWVVAEYLGVTLATDSRLGTPPTVPEGRALTLAFKPEHWKSAA